MERIRYLEDYKIGETRETSGRTITETDFVIHAGHSGDFFPHHMDQEFCRNTPWKKRIAHGTLTFTVGIGLTAREINPAAFTYGYERLRFPKPLYIGDTIHSKVTVSEVKPYPKRPNCGQVVETVEVINQNNDVVMFCRHILLVECSAPADPDYPVKT